LCEFVLNMTSLWEYDFSDMIIKTRVLIAFLVNFKSRNLVWILTWSVDCIKTSTSQLTPLSTANVEMVIRWISILYKIIKFNI
jgi:hypothetical protein